MSAEREELRGTLSNTICNASNYPGEAPVHLLGRDMSTVLDKTTDALLAAGWEKSTGNHFKLEANLTNGETVTVKVSGYTNIRQGCAALVKLADVNTLAQIIAGAEDDEDWS